MKTKLLEDLIELDPELDSDSEQPDYLNLDPEKIIPDALH